MRVTGKYTLRKYKSTTLNIYFNVYITINRTDGIGKQL